MVNVFMKKWCTMVDGVSNKIIWKSSISSQWIQGKRSGLDRRLLLCFLS